MWLVFEVDSCVVGLRGCSRNFMVWINYGMYSGVVMSKVRDRYIVDRIVIVMIDVLVLMMVFIDSVILVIVSRE